VTSRGHARWTIVEGADARYRSVAVGAAVLDAIRTHLEEAEEAKSAAQARAGRRAPQASRAKAARPDRSILASLSLKARVDPREAPALIETQQGRLNLLERRARARGQAAILVFEGWDAAGKGGVIRRITAALDARDYQVIPIAAPTDEERAHHYLWRFWRHLSRAGRVTIFDRSWYGRVLVERVEGFATEKEWLRAYAEINQFENQLVEHGIVLMKYWLHVSRDEQLRRFQEREQVPHKQWKLTEDDWRNREKWEAYERAVNDMIEQTSTRDAPWTLVEANDKSHARLKVLTTLCDRMERQVGKKGRA
jgi:AMP-polyphosphate phosphotransferase